MHSCSIDDNGDDHSATTANAPSWHNTRAATAANSGKATEHRNSHGGWQTKFTAEISISNNCAIRSAMKHNSRYNKPQQHTSDSPLATTAVAYTQNHEHSCPHKLCVDDPYPVTGDPLGTMPSSERMNSIPTFSSVNSPLNLLATAAAMAEEGTGTATQIEDTHMTSRLSLNHTNQYNPAAALPPKLVKCILDLEFVEMAELSMDVWDKATAPSEIPGVPRRPARRAPITNLNIWHECYGKMVAILCTRFPEKSPELWAYQSSIIRAARNYETGAWVAYDRQYRREALAAKILNWSTPNHQLYSEAFTGQVKIISRCSICLSNAHLANQCPSNPNPFAAWWAASNS